MFILRRYTGENHEVNTVLGNSYNLVRKDVNFDEFKRAYTAYSDGLEWDEESPITNTIYTFIIYNNGKDIVPLHRPSTYYIMTENGATFANLTFK